MEKRQGYIGSVERPIPHTGEPPSTFEHKLFTCDECGAVVVELAQEKHAAWHRNIREMLGRTGPLALGPLQRDVEAGRLTLEVRRSE
jgi:hypothetical protein